MNIKTSIAYFKATFSGDSDGDVDLELDRGDLPVCVQFADDFSIFWFVTRMYARFPVKITPPCSGKGYGCSSLQSGIRMPCG